MTVLDVDHRAVQTPVRHQGNRESCVGFAVSGAHEWMMADLTIMSVEDVLWAAHTQGRPQDCDETSVEFALQGLGLHRHLSEVAWPYGVPIWTSGRPSSASDSANLTSIPAWHRLGGALISDLQPSVSLGLAVIVTVGVVPYIWQTGTGEVDAPPGLKTKGNHAVLAVGTLDRNGSNCLLVKNSWGPDWGDLGYGYISDRYLSGYGRCAHVIEQAT
jgi:hypothetical protein